MSTKRRTLQLFDNLDAAHQQGAVVSLTGAGVSDALLLEDGRRTKIAKTLAAWAHQRNMQTITFSQAMGAEYVSAPGNPEPKGEPPGRRMMNTDEQLAALLDEVRNSAKPTTLVIDWTDILLQDNGTISDAQAVIIQRVAHLTSDGLFRSHGHFIILLVRTGHLNSRLSEFPGVVNVSLTIPDEEEIRVAINEMVTDPERTLRLDPSFTPERAVYSSHGLYLDDLLRLRDLSATSPITEAMLIHRKNQAIRRQGGDTVIVHDTIGYGEDRIAGMYGLKAALADMESVGVKRPQFLEVGPPGCGKSTAHKYVAHRRGEPAVEQGHVRERWVGASEERYDQYFETVDANEPVCQHWDECDSTLGRRSMTAGDESGTDARLRSKMFDYLGDVGTQKGGSILASTNRIDLMDEAAVDRFIVIPIIHPVGDERVQIMAIQAARSNRQFDAESVKKVMANVETMSGRHLVRLVDRAAVHAARRRSPVIESSDVQKALVESMYRLSSTEVMQALLAIRYTSFTPYLPWMAATAFGRDMRWPDYMDGLVNDDGTVRLDPLDKRLEDLMRAGAR